MSADLEYDPCTFGTSRAERRRILKKAGLRNKKLNVSHYKFSRKDRRHNEHATKELRRQ
jgi:hypothetical protein